MRPQNTIAAAEVRLPQPDGNPSSRPNKKEKISLSKSQHQLSRTVPTPTPYKSTARRGRVVLTVRSDPRYSRLFVYARVGGLLDGLPRRLGQADRTRARRSRIPGLCCVPKRLSTSTTENDPVSMLAARTGFGAHTHIEPTNRSCSVNVWYSDTMDSST